MTLPVLVVYCPIPASHADAVARVLVAERLVACVNRIDGGRSVYRWEGEIVEEPEALLLLKTHEDRWETLEARLTELHPYETPALLAFRPSFVNAAWASWLEEETRSDDDL